jgi:hypothetical protein
LHFRGFLSIVAQQATIILIKLIYRTIYAMYRIFLFFWSSCLIMLASLATTAHANADVALVTGIQGKVARMSITGPQPLEAFVKLKQGDVLRLEKASSVKLVYFEGGRQETWSGEGRLEIAETESKGSGLPAPETKVLPAVLVKQIAKTPSLDSQGRAGVMRLRALATPAPDALAKLEAEYDRMRLELGRNDLNADVFLLAGLLEMRALDRVEVILEGLLGRYPNDPNAKMLVDLYGKALSSARIKDSKSN